MQDISMILQLFGGLALFLFGMDRMSEALQQAAARRLEYPDLSLAALCGCFDPPMSKSGLSHRMKKLEALADALRQRLEEHTETEEEGA